MRYLFFLLVVAYANAFDVPKCDKNNKEVFFIKNINDWQHINDKDKRVFCIKPGIYESLGKILITSSGSRENPRYIILDNKNNLHSAQLQKKDLAKYLLYFQNASNWIVDRQAFWESKNPFFRNKIVNSKNIIFNRLYFEDSSSVFAIYNGSQNITIQNSFFEKTKWSVENKNFYDTAAINLICRNPDEAVKDIKIINNEIVNYVDAIQAVRYAKAYNSDAKIDFAGLDIENNLLYVTPLLYSNCKGGFDEDGECSFSENAIDLKGGSKDINNPVIIKNNTIFGYKRADNSYSNLSDPGSGIVMHYDVGNLVIKDNLLFNLGIGISSGAPIEGRVALKYAKIENNIFSNIKYYAIDIYGSLSGSFDGAKDIDISSNIFYKINAPVIKLYNTLNVAIDNNFFINSKPFWIPDFTKNSKYQKYKNDNLTIFNNKFFKSEIQIPSFAKASENINIDSFNFNTLQREITINKFTNYPKKIYLLGEGNE